MINPAFPYPSTDEPLRRLNVYDSLMMNAERWQLAHHYHRKRQNVLYQALYQPGIVYGLGVKVIEPPIASSSTYRQRDQERSEQRWIEIQAGLAIDCEGNPIVVDGNTDRTYRIAATAPTKGTLTIYIVVSFVEPDTLEHPPHEVTIPERFRFDQKTEPPTAHEVELCRIQIPPLGVCLAIPPEPLFPALNQLDLRHRVQAQVRSHACVRVGAIEPLSNQTYENLSDLIESLPALFPTLQGKVEPALNLVQNTGCDLLYLTLRKFLSLEESSLNQLRGYLARGGMIFMEAVDGGMSRAIDDKFKQLCPFETLLDWEQLPSRHPLRTKPFLFTELPTLKQRPIQMQVSSQGSLVLVSDCLSVAWGMNEKRPRHESRAAQEFGINLLHFTWQRQHFAHLLQ